MAGYRYFPRYLAYQGPGNVSEFFLYAVGILSIISVLWWGFRRLVLPAPLLVLLEVGILLHFAGGFVAVDGQRLYDTTLFGISAEYLRFDKLVHLVNAFTVTLLVLRLVQSRTHVVPMVRLFALLAVLGLGATVELIEFSALKLFAQTGVGSYDNNMLDLVANLGGATLGAVLGPARS